MNVVALGLYFVTHSLSDDSLSSVFFSAGLRLVFHATDTVMVFSPCSVYLLKPVLLVFPDLTYSFVLIWFVATVNISLFAPCRDA